MRINSVEISPLFYYAGKNILNVTEHTKRRMTQFKLISVFHLKDIYLYRVAEDSSNDASVPMCLFTVHTCH